MNLSKVMLDRAGQVLSPDDVRKLITDFNNSYTDATKKIIVESQGLDQEGKKFIECASLILSNFGMTRAGTFHGDNTEILQKCWGVVGIDLLKIHKSVRKSGLPRDRYIVEIGESKREALFDKIWRLTKKLLPYTRGATSNGLVGASKILFSVLPEIVLPVDNAEWQHVFQTVDLGDVLRIMVADIQEWEAIQGIQLTALDDTRRLTTLPAVYNVLAMEARPKVKQV